MKRLFGFIFLSIALQPGNNATASSISRQQAEEAMQTAALSYQEGRFEEALNLYTGVMESGYTSADLYYNVGNCHFKLNAIPNAILWYERALRLEPSDEDILFNLNLARSRIVDKIEEVPKLFFVKWWDQLRDIYGQDGWAVAGLISFGTFILLLLVFLLSSLPWLKRTAFIMGIIVLVISAHTFAFAWQKHRIAVTQPYAIIMTPAVTVKSSPDQSSIDLFVIHEGTRVQVTDQLGEWLEVRIPSGERGWLNENSLERI
jgi:SH3-like domain-containing protein